MSQDPPYRSEDEDDQGDKPDEGVRIIDPGEAAEVAERGDAVRRKSSDQPRYGDRPASPPADTKPMMRFPLSESMDPSAVERPRVAPVDPPGIDDFVTVEDTLAPADPPDDEFYEESDDDGYDDGDIISVEPATSETQLLHWTAPPTGEVPRVIVGEDEAEPDDDARWTSFASNSPRWRDEHDQWDDAVDMSDLVAPEEDQTFTAEPDPMTQEEYLNFDDLEVPGEPVSSRGSASDPIQIQSSQPRPANPDIPPGPAPGQAPPPPPRSRQRRKPANPAPSDGGRGGTDVDGQPADGEPPAGRDVSQATFVGVVIAVAAAVAFKLGPSFALVFVEAVVVLAAIEFFGALRRGGLRPATLLGLAAVAALPLAAYWRGEGALPLVMFLTLVFTVLWFILGIGGNARPLPNTAVTLLGVFYVGLLGSFGALILGIPSEGVSILLLAVISGVAYDVGGFFIGRQWGTRPLTSVSPNKTVEGLIGGMACALLAALIVGGLVGVGPFSFGGMFVFGLFVAIAAPIGDLSESLFKRDLGLKDMGTIIPGHGGVLDRFDGLLFVLPAAYYLARVLL